VASFRTCRYCQVAFAAVAVASSGSKFTARFGHGWSHKVRRGPTIGSRPDVPAFGGYAALTWALGITMSTVAAMTLVLGLAASAYLGLYFIDGEPLFAAALNAVLLLPGLFLTLRIAGSSAPAPSLRPPLSALLVPLLIVALLLHSLSLFGPVTKEQRFVSMDQSVFIMQYGHEIFSFAFIFPNTATAHIPWWAANLVIALLPLMAVKRAPAARAFIAVLALLLGGLAWAPFFDQSNEIWRSHKGLYWGYYVWAFLLSVLGATLAASFIGGAAQQQVQGPTSPPSAEPRP